MTATWVIRAAGALAGLALLVLLVASVAAVVAETGADPDEAAAGEVTAVVALVRGEGRLAVAEAVRARTGKALVISARPADTTTPGGATPPSGAAEPTATTSCASTPNRMPRDMLVDGSGAGRAAP